MNVPTIQMSKHEARVAFLEYRAAVQEAMNREVETADWARQQAIRAQRESDEALMRGYRQLSLGLQVISLRDVIHDAGEDEHGRPKLAIARADHVRIRMRRSSRGGVVFDGFRQRSDHRNPRTSTSLRVPEGTLPLRGDGSWRNSVDAEAVVPTIPPRLRPKQLDRYHVLWEAAWEDVPVDPALLRALGDGLFAVVATWDLTPLEQHVLRMRVQ